MIPTDSTCNSMPCTVFHSMHTDQSAGLLLHASLPGWAVLLSDVFLLFPESCALPVWLSSLF